MQTLTDKVLVDQQAERAEQGSLKRWDVIHKVCIGIAVAGLWVGGFMSAAVWAMWTAGRPWAECTPDLVRISTVFIFILPALAVAYYAHRRIRHDR